MSNTFRDNGINVGEVAGSTTAAEPAARPSVMAQRVEAPGGFRGRISGYAERGIDAVAGAAGRGADPRVGQAKDFVRSKPLAVAALAGVVGLALLNTLRGKGRA